MDFTPFQHRYVATRSTHKLATKSNMQSNGIVYFDTLVHTDASKPPYWFMESTRSMLLTSKVINACPASNPGQNGHRYQHWSKKSRILWNLGIRTLSGKHSTSNGCHYFAVFLDNETARSAVYFLRWKSELPVAFQQYKALVENELNYRMKRIQLVGAGQSHTPIGLGTACLHNE